MRPLQYRAGSAAIDEDGTKRGFRSTPSQACRLQCHEASDVFRRDLHPQSGAKCVDAAETKILVEVPEPRRQRDRLDPSFERPVDQALCRIVAGRIVVAGDVETAKRCREQNRSEVRGRERTGPFDGAFGLPERNGD